MRYPYPEFPLVLPDGSPALRHDKGFQLINFDELPVSIVNTQMMPHSFLGSSYESTEGRRFAAKMEEMIETYVMPKTSIIIGDFNYGAAELLYTRILSKMKSALPDAPTRPGGKKTDYVFVPESCQVIASGIVQTNTDHYLCWVKLSL